MSNIPVGRSVTVTAPDVIGAIRKARGRLRGIVPGNARVLLVEQGEQVTTTPWLWHYEVVLQEGWEEVSDS